MSGWLKDHWAIVAWLLAVTFFAGNLWAEVKANSLAKGQVADELQEMNTRLSRIEGALGLRPWKATQPVLNTQP